MSPPIQLCPMVATSAHGIPPTVGPIVIPTATDITMGSDLTAPGIPPTNSLPAFPTQPFIPPFNITQLPPPFDSSDPFPSSSADLFDGAAESNLPIGMFDPYHHTYLTRPPSPSANNYMWTAGLSTTMAQGSAVGMDHSKRSCPQEDSQGNGQSKQQKVQRTANHTVREQESNYQGFQVGQSEGGTSLITSMGYGAAPEINHSQSNGVASSSASLPVVNEGPTTDNAPPHFQLLPHPPGISDMQYGMLITAQIAKHLPDTGR